MTETEFRQEVMPLQRFMYGIALRMGIPPDEAGDAVQEALLRLWRHREGIPRAPGELRLYCMTALRNQCLSQLGKMRRDAEIGEAVSIPAVVADDTEYKDTRFQIECLIDRLPEGQRRVIRLSSFEGLGNDEIAALTGQTDNNVRQLLSRGRKRLRQLIADLF